MAKAFLPMRGPLHAPELVLRWRGVRATPKQVDAVCSLAEQPRSEFLPFLHFQIVGRVV